MQLITTIIIFFSELDITIYPPEGDPPANWWDEECDKSLLVGVYKYGECADEELPFLNTNSGSEHCSVFSHVIFSCFNTSPNGSKWL